MTQTYTEKTQGAEAASDYHVIRDVWKITTFSLESIESHVSKLACVHEHIWAVCLNLGWGRKDSCGISDAVNPGEVSAKAFGTRPFISLDSVSQRYISKRIFMWGIGVYPECRVREGSKTGLHY